MKTKNLKNIVLLYLIFLSLSVYAFDGKGKFLVYVSNDQAENNLYATLLKMKFPDLDTMTITSDQDFEKFIPMNKYFPVKINPSLKASDDDDDKVDNPEGATYFLDIMSQSEYSTFHSYDHAGRSQSTSFYSQTRTLYLVKYYEGKFYTERLMTVYPVHGYGKRTSINQSEIAQLSKDINPVLVTMYLHALNNKKFYSNGISNTCKIDSDDSVYLCPISNNEFVSRKVGLERRERKFRTHVRYFKHAHRKLTSQEFAKKAIEMLKDDKSFYFYYFHQNGNRPVMMVIDLRTFEVLSSYTKTFKVMFMDFPMKKTIKKSSKKIVCKP